MTTYLIMNPPTQIIQQDRQNYPTWQYRIGKKHHLSSANLGGGEEKNTYLAPTGGQLKPALPQGGKMSHSMWSNCLEEPGQKQPLKSPPHPLQMLIWAWTWTAQPPSWVAKFQALPTYQPLLWKGLHYPSSRGTSESKQTRKKEQTYIHVQTYMHIKDGVILISATMHFLRLRGLWKPMPRDSFRCSNMNLLFSNSLNLISYWRILVVIQFKYHARDTQIRILWCGIKTILYYIRTRSY